MIVARISLTLLGTVLCCAAAPEAIMKDGVRYFVWKAKAEDVRVVWKDGGGKQLRDFPAAKAYIEGRGEKPLMLMNGGIFEPGQVPSGVMVQEGRELLPVNRKNGEWELFPQTERNFSDRGKGCTGGGDG